MLLVGYHLINFLRHDSIIFQTMIPLFHTCHRYYFVIRLLLPQLWNLNIICRLLRTRYWTSVVSKYFAWSRVPCRRNFIPNHESSNKRWIKHMSSVSIVSAEGLAPLWARIPASIADGQVTESASRKATGPALAWLSIVPSGGRPEIKVAHKRSGFDIDNR